MTETLPAATVHSVIYGDSDLPGRPLIHIHISLGPDKRHVFAGDEADVLSCTIRDGARKTKRLITCLVGEVITPRATDWLAAVFLCRLHSLRRGR